MGLGRRWGSWLQSVRFKDRGVELEYRPDVRGHVGQLLRPIPARLFVPGRQLSEAVMEFQWGRRFDDRQTNNRY